MVIKAKFLLVFIISLTLTACASLYSNKSHYEDIDYHLETGDSLTALQMLQDSKDDYYAKKDRVLFYLEEGMLSYYAGEYEKSNESLTQAEYAIEELLVNSISKGILSGVLNDNALDYPGEDYEDIYINIFKALNYLSLNSTEEALIEIRRVNDKLNALETKYSEQIESVNNSEDVDIPNAEYNFYNDALARYLGIIAYRLEGSFDDSRIEADYFNKSFQFQPQVYDFPKPKVPKLSSDSALINILCFTGFAPEKEAETIIAASGYNGVYLESDNIGISAIGYNNLSSDFNLKLQFPVLVKKNDPVHSIEIFVDGKSYGKLEMVESIENIALETFKVKQPLIIGKTVIRAVSKAIASEVTESIASDEFGAGVGLLTGLIGDIYMHATENSDLRISRYFPSKVWGLEIESNPGVFNFSIVYYNEFGSVLYEDKYDNVEIKENGLNLIKSHLVRK